MARGDGLPSNLTEFKWEVEDFPSSFPFLPPEVHAHFIRSRFGSGVIMGSALVDMYANCEDVEDSLKVFEKMLERNVVS